MNLGQIITDVQRQFGDESEAQITRADIVSWANSGQVDINRKTEVLQIHVETNAIQSDGSYHLPTDAVRIRRVTYDQEKLQQTTLEALDSSDASRDSSPDGKPKYFYVWGRKLWIYPRPLASGSGNLDMYYVKMPDVLVANEDVPEIPLHMHEDIVRYCLGRAKELDEDYGKAQEVMQDYETRVNLSKNESQQPMNNSYPSVRDIDAGYGYGDYYV